MQMTSPLLRAAWVKREKRFFGHAVLEATGEAVVAHCANTGSLKGVLDGADERRVAAVWLSDHGSLSGRTLRYTLELVEWADGTLIGVHTGRTNALAEEAVRQGVFPELNGFTELRREVKVDAHTRFDLQAVVNSTPWWIEVKNVSMKTADGLAAFPDGVSARGLKHLGVLEERVRAGEKALQLFVVQRPDCEAFRPAEEIDPAYAAGLQQAQAAGVVVTAVDCAVFPAGISVRRKIPVLL